MTRRAGALALGGLALVLGMVLPGCGRSERTGAAEDTTALAATTADPSGPATRTSEGGEATVAVTWRGPDAGPVFEVVMDTHSGDLDGYDLRELAVLRNGRGVEARPIGWSAPEGGHHREGTLSFPRTAAGGSEPIGPDVRRIELVIRDVAGVPERRFEWTF